METNRHQSTPERLEVKFSGQNPGNSPRRKAWHASAIRLQLPAAHNQSDEDHEMEMELQKRAEAKRDKRKSDDAPEPHYLLQLFSQPSIFVHYELSRQLYVDLDASKAFGFGAIVYHSSDACPGPPKNIGVGCTA